MVVGITGKIASGKSEALRILAKHDFYCIDADKIVHDLYRNGRAGQKLVKEHFGNSYLLSNGDVDRIKLAELVFNDVSKLELLNKLIHPLVAGVVENIINNEVNDGRNVAIEAVYFEDEHLLKMVDKMVLIERDFSKIRNVLMTERGLASDIAVKIYDSVKASNKSHFVIKNDGSIDDLENELLKIV